MLDYGLKPNTKSNSGKLNYESQIFRARDFVRSRGETWRSIDPENITRMRLQNQFRTGLDIARYTAKIMRDDMAAYDLDSKNYTKSLGCWHGFVAQQKMISVKKHFGDTKGSYLYLSGWMVAAMRSKFGPLPDQSMHEKTSVPDLVEEIYQFLKQADTREIGKIFQEIDDAKELDNSSLLNAARTKLGDFKTHIVPIIADIDAGFGNEEATYLLAKKMIEAGACCIQIENQVSDAKQCGHQDGKVTVPHEDFLAKINAVRYAFMELGVEDGIIVARTDSLGAGLTQKIPVSQETGDLADLYNGFIDGETVNSLEDVKSGDLLLKQGNKLIKPTRLPNGLIRFKKGSGEDRVILDCISSLQNGADLLWIETEKPHVGQIANMVNRIREVVPNAKLVYNNSPSFNWTLNFRQQVYDAWSEAGVDLSKYRRSDLMNADYDATELGQVADEKIRRFHEDSARDAGIFHHLITLPTYHTAAQSTDVLARKYFAEDGMLAYVRDVQRSEIRDSLACVKHQDMSGSNIGDDHKEYFSGSLALKAAGKDNTMNQFN